MRGMAVMGLGAIAGMVVLAFVSVASAVQEPGTEYVFVIDDANSFMKLDVGGGGTVTAQARFDGWLSLYLGDPTPGSPRTWNVHCLLGRAGMSNPEDFVLKVGFPFNIDGYIGARDLRVFDMDVWYQDPNDWYDPNEVIDPNGISPGDPNDPNYHDPNDPTILRWTDLTGGPSISSGVLNSEILCFWAFVLVPHGKDPNDPNNWSDADSAQEWSRPFRYWQVKVADSPLLFNRAGMPTGPVQTVIDWQVWITGSIPILGIYHMEGAGGRLRNLDVEVVKPQYGSVTVDPAPVDPNRLGQKYIEDTVVTLTATPISGKAFGGWAIWNDPTKYPDANFAVLDSNAVTQVVMDSDKVAEATFKCGSGVEPFIGIALFALVIGVVVRRSW